MTIPAFITVTVLSTTAQGVERSHTAIVGLDHLVSVEEISATGTEAASEINTCTGDRLLVKEEVDQILTAIRSLEEPRVTIQNTFTGGGGGQ